MSKVLTAVFLIWASCFARAESAAPARLHILTYEEVKNLSDSERNEYVRSVAQALVVLEKQRKVNKYSFIEELFSLGSLAHAAVTYRCIGAGVPVSPSSPICGMQSYAGFSCSAGENICNPTVFGVSASGEPTCRVGATTEWCYNNTVLGRTHFLEPVFAKNSPTEWNTMRDELERACNDPSLVGESRSEIARACRFIRAQKQVNRARSLLKENYSYQTEAAACTDCGIAGPRPLPTDLREVGAVVATGRALHIPTAAEAESFRFRGSPYRPARDGVIPGVAGTLLNPMPMCRKSANTPDFHWHGNVLHSGQDLATGVDLPSPIQSVAPGVVVDAHSACRDYRGGCNKGFGNLVVIMHKTAAGEIFYSNYQHLTSVNLKPGDVVGAGTSIGMSGATGKASARHLHFEIFDRNQKRTDPMKYYPGGICTR